MAYLLIVDDDADFASAVSTVLCNRGHEVAIETDCLEAASRIAQRRPDLVVLDVMFPEDETAGYKVAGDIRRTFGELPILLLTAVNHSFVPGFHDGDLEEPRLPTVGFLEKPVDLSHLCAVVSEILAGTHKATL